MSTRTRTFLTLAAVSALLLTSSASAALFTPTDIEVGVAPTTTMALNNRGDQDNSIDGNSGTFSYLTPAYTTVPQIALLDLGGSITVEAIRVNKESADTDGGNAPVDAMDLRILYTTDVGSLESRTYTAVSGLTNDGSEPITAVSVNSGTGTVDNDTHGAGIYRLNFDAVSATTIGFGFARAPGGDSTATHYPTYEFEIIDSTAATNSPTDIEVVVAPTIVLNNRGDQDLSIDGNSGTFSFLTPANTAVPQIAMLDLGGSITVDAIRVNKESANTDGQSVPPLVDAMDLRILYTTDVGSLESRTYTAVSGLTNDGSEPITAVSVNSGTGTVDNDTHGAGIYRLNFDAVSATAIGFRFARDPGDPISATHYPTYEFEINEVPEPSSFALALVGSLALVGWRRRRRR